MRTYTLFLMIGILCLAGCGRIVDWTKEKFDQGTEFKTNLSDAKKQVRSVTAYDQLETAAMFDALWLSDDVRTSYVRLFIDRRGKGEEHYKTILRRQLEENNFVLAFYVLSPYEIALNDADGDWMTFLRIGDKQYAPVEVKVVDLAPEYRAIFDKNFTRFKQAYLVKFDARNVDDAPIITPTTRKISLVFRSLTKDLTMTWDVARTVRAAEQVVLATPMVGSAAAKREATTPVSVSAQK